MQDEMGWGRPQRDTHDEEVGVGYIIGLAMSVLQWFNNNNIVVYLPLHFALLYYNYTLYYTPANNRDSKEQKSSRKCETKLYLVPTNTLHYLQLHFQ